MAKQRKSSNSHGFRFRVSGRSANGLYFTQINQRSFFAKRTLVDIESLGFPEVFPFDFFFFCGIREDSFFPGRRKNAIVPDAAKAFGQKMQAESSDKFLGRKTHHFIAVAVAIVLVFEGDLILVVVADAMIGDGNVVCVSSEILQQRRRYKQRIGFSLKGVVMSKLI